MSAGSAAPRSAAPERVAILGAGRAGCALHAALFSAGHHPRLWTRSEATAAAARSEGFEVSTGEPAAFIGDASLVLFAVTDPAVEELAARLAAAAGGSVASGRTFAHLAGALTLEPLAPLRAAGAFVGSLHPLASLSTRHAPLAGHACAVEASDAHAREVLWRLAQDVGLRPFAFAGDRARYHAAACLAGNYPQALLDAAVQLLVGEGMPRADALAALGPMLEGAARRAAALGPERALSGPVARGDDSTVRRHLAAISNPEIAALYRSAGLVAARLARSPAAVIDALVSPPGEGRSASTSRGPARRSRR